MLFPGLIMKMVIANAMYKKYFHSKWKTLA